MAARLVDLKGNLRTIELPITAAEIMMEEPGHVISAAIDDYNNLRSAASRFSAMKAEDQLCRGKLYVLVPVGRLNSKLSDSDLVILESVCKKKRRGSSRGHHHRSKILPTSAELGDSEEKPDSCCPVMVSSSRDNVCLSSASPARVRQWKPSLDSISEV